MGCYRRRGGWAVVSSLAASTDDGAITHAPSASATQVGYGFITLLRKMRTPAQLTGTLCGGIERQQGSWLKARATLRDTVTGLLQAGLRAYEWHWCRANRLPTKIRSGIRIRRNSITVAGAAPELSYTRIGSGRTDFPFHPFGERREGTPKSEVAPYSRDCVAGKRAGVHATWGGTTLQRPRTASIADARA